MSLNKQKSKKKQLNTDIITDDPGRLISNFYPQHYQNQPLPCFELKKVLQNCQYAFAAPIAKEIPSFDWQRGLYRLNFVGPDLTGRIRE